MLKMLEPDPEHRIGASEALFHPYIVGSRLPVGFKPKQKSEIDNRQKLAENM